MFLFLLKAVVIIMKYYCSGGVCCINVCFEGLLSPFLSVLGQDGGVGSAEGEVPGHHRNALLNCLLTRNPKSFSHTSDFVALSAVM